ncbi:P1 family peptidase [Plantibacter sp. Mn2098]|uniref:P1 family peptidase n=1 Tax=Plantibacter sp. Mn2098 TaxID=3395266 RepID=UPI003BE56649
MTSNGPQAPNPLNPDAGRPDAGLSEAGTSGAEAGATGNAFDWRLGGEGGGRPGPNNDLSDVPGLRVGHASRVGDGWLTGSTVVLADVDLRAAVDVRGGGAASRETDALHPTGVVDAIQAVHLGGGSAYGLDAAGGVMRELEAADRGFRVGAAYGRVVPIVPAAALFDLGRGGDFSARPDAELGAEAARAALAAAAGTPVVQGSVGAGTGAITGEMRGGIGSASVVLPGGVTVAALVVVNADGSALDPRTGIPLGIGRELLLADGSGEFGLTAPDAAAVARARERLEAAARARPALRPLNTTLAIVATDAPLDRAQLWKLAGTSHDGIARGIRPVHTLGDGDLVFALSTARGGWPTPDPALLENHQRNDQVNRILTAGADVVSRAIVHAVLAATSIETPAGLLPSYRDLFA